MNLFVKHINFLKGNIKQKHIKKESKAWNRSLRSRGCRKEETENYSELKWRVYVEESFEFSKDKILPQSHHHAPMLSGNIPALFVNFPHLWHHPYHHYPDCPVNFHDRFPHHIEVNKSNHWIMCAYSCSHCNINVHLSLKKTSKEKNGVERNRHIFIDACVLRRSIDSDFYGPLWWAFAFLFEGNVWRK